MHKSYAIEDGCHNCGWLAEQLEIVIPKDKDLLCAESPVKETVMQGVQRLDVVKFAVVHPAGKCDAWKAKR